MLQGNQISVVNSRQKSFLDSLKWTDAYKTAIEMADDRGIVVNPDNKEWQQLWEDYRASLNLPLLTMFQGPDKEQPTYARYYTRWNEVKPFK